jgi:hypothetical protein
MSDKRAEILEWLSMMDRHQRRGGVWQAYGLALAALKGEVEGIYHRSVDDCWYSCPLALNQDGGSECCNDREVAAERCTCGADDQLARIHRAFGLGGGTGAEKA